MEFISYQAISTSADLATEKRGYSSYLGSKWERGIFPLDTLDLLEEQRGEKVLVDRISRLDWSPIKKLVKQNGMRNSNCMAIAPTATIANIAGCFPSIEPIYKNVYVKSNMSGEFTVVNHYLIDDLKKLGLWNQTLLEAIKGNDGNIDSLTQVPQTLKDKYKEVFDIEPEWLIKTAAYRGKWIDQSQSLNLFIKGHSGKKISDLYLYAWAMGLKTTYYLRSLGATVIEKSTIELNKQNSMSSVSSQEKISVEVKITEPIVTPVTQPVAVAAGSVGGVKLCKIADPTCEACQ